MWFVYVFTIFFFFTFTTAANAHISFFFFSPKISLLLQLLLLFFRYIFSLSTFGSQCWSIVGRVDMPLNAMMRTCEKMFMKIIQIIGRNSFLPFVLLAKKLASPDVYERTVYKINAKWICLDGRKSACRKVRLTIKKNIGNYIYFYYTWRMQWPMKQNVCNAIVGTSWCALALMYAGFSFSFVQLFTFIIISISFLFYTLQFFVIFCFSIVKMCVRLSVAVLLLLVLRL